MSLPGVYVWRRRVRGASGRFPVNTDLCNDSITEFIIYDKEVSSGFG